MENYREMKRQWDIEELIEHFTLIEGDLDALTNKTGPTRLGYALLLKCFQYEGRFPPAKHDIPKSVVDYIARQLKLDPALYTQYDWEGRTIKGHRTQIREQLAFREATALDTEEMKSWLIAEKLASDQNIEHLKVIVTKRFRDLKIEPPTPDRIERLIRSGCSTYEQTLFAEILQRLPSTTRTLLDELLSRSEVAAEHEEQRLDDEPMPTTSLIRQTSITLLAAFCQQRTGEVTDSLVDLLLLVIRRIGAKAEKHVKKQYLDDIQTVEGKQKLLRQVAEAALDGPDKTVRAGIFPVMSEVKCRAILKEYQAKGEYQEQVYQRMRSSYRDHYRRMVPLLVNMLDIRSNNTAHRPVVDALTLVKRYAGASGIYYPAEEMVPLVGVVRPMWRGLVQEKTPLPRVVGGRG
jgi:Domain of unknown function (DUF4158)